MLLKSNLDIELVYGTRADISLIPEKIFEQIKLIYIINVINTKLAPGIGGQDNNIPASQKH